MRLILLLYVCSVLVVAFTGPKRWSGVKIKYFIKAIAAKEEAIAEKEKAIALITASKEKAIAAKEEAIALITASQKEAIAAKEETIAAKEKIIASKDEVIEQCKERLSEMRENSLRSKGLLTSRGIFEYFLRYCFDELVLKGFFPKGAKFNVTSTISKLKSEEGRIVSSPEMVYCNELFSFQKQCGLTDLSSLFQELSRDVHGYPWSGEGVRVHGDLLSKQSFTCFVGKIAASFKLKTQDEEGNTMVIPCESPTVGFSCSTEN